MSKFFILFIAISAFLSESLSEAFICTTTGRFHNAYDPTCKTYYLCSNDGEQITSTLYKCSNTFDPNASDCSDYYVCKKPAFTCTASGYFPALSTTTCSSYYNCFNFFGFYIKFSHSCRNGDQFDPVKNVCSASYKCENYLLARKEPKIIDASATDTPLADGHSDILKNDELIIEHISSVHGPAISLTTTQCVGNPNCLYIEDLTETPMPGKEGGTINSVTNSTTRIVTESAREIVAEITVETTTDLVHSTTIYSSTNSNDEANSIQTIMESNIKEVLTGEEETIAFNIKADEGIESTTENTVEIAAKSSSIDIKNTTEVTIESIVETVTEGTIKTTHRMNSTTQNVKNGVEQEINFDEPDNSINVNYSNSVYSSTSSNVVVDNTKLIVELNTREQKPAEVDDSALTMNATTNAKSTAETSTQNTVETTTKTSIEITSQTLGETTMQSTTQNTEGATEEKTSSDDPDNSINLNYSNSVYSSTSPNVKADSTQSIVEFNVIEILSVERDISAKTDTDIESAAEITLENALETATELTVKTTSETMREAITESTVQNVNDSTTKEINVDESDNSINIVLGNSAYSSTSYIVKVGSTKPFAELNTREALSDEEGATSTAKTVDNTAKSTNESITNTISESIREMTIKSTTQNINDDAQKEQSFGEPYTSINVDYSNSVYLSTGSNVETYSEQSNTGIDNIETTETLSVTTLKTDEEEFVCQTVGRYPDYPNENCTRYFLCSRLNNGTFLRTPYNCPVDSYFDPEIKRCSRTYRCHETITVITTTAFHTTEDHTTDVGSTTLKDIETTESHTIENECITSEDFRGTDFPITDTERTTLAETQTSIIAPENEGATTNPTTATTEQPEYLMCTSKGRFPNLSDETCTTYFLCSRHQNGTFVSTLFTCQESFFDPSLGRCSKDYKCPYGDTITEISTIIAKTTTNLTTSTTKQPDHFVCTSVGRFPDFSDETCTIYFLCSRRQNDTFVKTLFTCQGSLFDPNIGRCSKDYKCLSTDTTTEISTSEWDFTCSKVGRFKNENDFGCKSYFLCSQFRNGTFFRTQYDCPKSSLFNSVKHMCSDMISCFR